MYTLLLVDDEEEVIEAIVKKVKWEELGFQVTGHANNGFKAMDMLEEMQPDVVMTDIRMPYMDGLELCAHIKAKYPATKILLFTGFDDFEYAKEAVHLEIEEYILKPLNAVEITEVFKRLKEKLDYEISEKRNTDLLKKYYADSLPMLQANLYTTLIEGRIPEEEMPHYFKDYQIAFTGPWYCCLIIHTSASQVPEGMDIRLLSVSVDRQAGENLGEKWNAKRFRYLGDTIMIMQLKSEEEISELTDACDRFCKYIHHIMGAKVTIGIGQVCGHIAKIAASYQSAREAVSYRVLYGSNRAINLKEIVPQRKIQRDAGEKTELSNVFKKICLGENEDIANAIEVYMQHKFLDLKSLEKYHVAVMELIGELYHFMVNNEMDTTKIPGGIGSLYNELCNLEPQVLQKWLLKFCCMLHDDMADARYHSKKSLIGRAKEYVHDNYQQEDLGLDDICKELGVSNSNLSIQSSKTIDFSRLHACFSFKPYLFALVFALTSRNKGNFLFPADHLIQQPCGSTLRFPCRVSVDVHCGTDIRVSEKFLHIFRLCAAGQQIACVGVTERVKMEIFKPFHFLLCRPAHNPYRTRRFIRPVCSQADKGDFLIVLRDFLCPLPAVNLIIGAPFFLYFFVVVQVIKLPVAETVFALFCSCRPQDCRQRVAEINGADFAPLCRSHFGCVPCSVIAHTAAYREILLLKVNILPSQAAYFPDTKPRVVRYLHRQQSGIIFCLEKFLQLLELFMGDSRNTGGIFLAVRENIRFLLPAPQLHILHRVKGNQLFREYRKAEGILQHRREQEHIPFAHGL